MLSTLRKAAYVLIGGCAAVTFFDTVGYVAAVDGISMQPVLNPTRGCTDYVFLNRWKTRKMQYTRGQVVSLTSPTNPNESLIKRIIALEGDTVRTLSYKNRVVEVPKGHCWVEGDHYGYSLDSNMFGPISIGLITSKASHIVWPPRRYQRLNTIVPEPHRVESAYHKDKVLSSELTRISCTSDS